MLKLLLHNQKGIISQAILVLLLVIGILVGTILIGQRTNLFSHASGSSIVIVDENGAPITSTDKSSIKVHVTPPWKPKAIPSPTPSPSPSPVACKPQKFDQNTWQLVQMGGCVNGKANVLYQCQKKSKIVIEKCTSVVHDQPNGAMVDCDKQIVLAEDPNFTVNVQSYSYISTPMDVYYDLSQPTKKGPRLIYAKFTSFDENDNLKTVKSDPPFVTINLKDIPKPTASLALNPSQATFNRGCSYNLKVNFDTAGLQSDSSEAILIYEPAKIVINSTSSGGFYPSYFATFLDPDGSDKKKIDLTGLTAARSLAGAGVLANVNISIPQDAPTGPTAINFDFDPANPGKTTDSNIAQPPIGTAFPQDILGSVTNGNYTIGDGVCQ